MGEHINGETDGMDRDAVKNYCREFKEKHFKGRCIQQQWALNIF